MTNTKSSRTLIGVVLMVFVLLTGLLGFAVPATFAQGTNTPGPIRATADARAATAESKSAEINKQLYERAQKMLAEQKKNLEQANKAIAKAQEWIDDLKAKGQTTTALDTALANYKTQIASAQTLHDTSQKTFDAHAGFDNNGNVTNMIQARETVLIVTRNARESHLILQKANVDFQNAVRAYRQANKPTPKP